MGVGRVLSSQRKVLASHTCVSFNHLPCDLLFVLHGVEVYNEILLVLTMCIKRVFPNHYSIQYVTETHFQILDVIFD